MRGLGLLTICLTLMAIGCTKTADRDVVSKLEAAERAFLKASTPSESAAVAARYEEILATGFVSGGVLYNQGNAWMKAEKPGYAIACYREAKQYLPRDPDLSGNLNLALKQVERPDDSSGSILEFLFFWQDDLSWSEKGSLATAILAVAMISLVLQAVGWGTGATKFTGICAALLFVLLAISFARDWMRFHGTQRGVIIESSSIARLGAAETYEPAFNRPLTEGMEFRMIGRQGKWLHVDVEGLSDCWVPEKSCVIVGQH